MYLKRPLIAAATAALLIATAALLGLPPGAEAATSRVLTITQTSAAPQVPFQAFDGNPPKVFDINGDGKLEIIAQNDNQWVYVFDSSTGRILNQLKTTFPAGWQARSFNGPEVAIIEQGGIPRLVVANSAAVVTMYRYDQTGSSPTHFAFVKEWDRRLNDCHPNPGMDAKPVLHDLDKDGRLEIIVATEELGTFALRDNGQLAWKNCMGGGNADPTVADLNMDGWPDVVHVSDGGIVSALNGRSGAWIWSFNALKSFNLGSASMPVGAAVAQLDGVGGPDVVVGARDSHNADDQTQNHAMLFAIDHAGKLLWAQQDPAGNPLTYTHPIVVDVDHDGASDVFWADWNTIGHKPPFNESEAWKRTGPANFYRFDRLGNMVWKQSLDTFWNNKDLSLADVVGDDGGAQEVLANGPNALGRDGMWYLDAATGAKEAHVETYPWKVMRAPILADLWNTTTMQWVVPVAGQAEGAGHGIQVYDTAMPYNSLWPHLPYPTVGPKPPAPRGTFDATFTIKSPNEWWQELTVKPTTTRSLAKVDVRMNGGFWQPMELRSWGAWASSYRAPAGTQVEFLATDADNFVSQSLAFTWMDGTLVKASVPSGDPPPTTSPATTTPPTTYTVSPPGTTTTTVAPPPTTTTTVPTGAFDATFSPTSSINEWWIEATVSANKPIEYVAVSVNGANYVKLNYTSWKTWAKSLNAPRGTAVVFQAVSTSNEMDLSQTYYWMLSGDPGFQASFAPQAVGNDWWVEVKVTSTKSIGSVEAQVNGGEWKPLTKQSWGNWAKSFFVANGSEVRFRATSTAGETALSGPTVWT
jgi:hypothetical protein